MNEIIYILTNEAMPGYVKIGKTANSVEQRILELSRSSAVPMPFECYYAARVKDMGQVEKAFHDAFGDYRINPRREFFNVAPEKVVAILKLLALEEVTPGRNVGIETKEDAIAIERARKKRSAFNFKMVDIPAGAELKFIRDEKIICVVAPDQKHVVFNGQEMSSSEAAALALGSKWWPQGPGYWTYNGETLDDRRLRMEEGDEPTPEEIEAAGDAWMQQQADIERGK
ncbi:MAG: GIY-YIG nuclease family protein [Candidatus Wildermuthbacteria bacterium]|nr:GIY-YIG nuclease family protein [Candidatus Wildermuthbacteria bacterium]